MLFNPNNGMQKAYVYINNEDFVNFLSKNSKSQAIKIDLPSIKSYLRSKGFNGFILKKSKNLYVILNEKSEAVKMFHGLGTMFKWLQLEANTIQCEYMNSCIKIYAPFTGAEKRRNVL